DFGARRLNVRRATARFESAMLVRHELTNGRFKDAGVEIDVGFGCGWRHERHVVERCEQNAAIERVEMHEALQIKIGRGSGFSAVARRVRTEEILGAAAEARYVPRQARGLDRFGDSFCKSLRERNHTGERLRSKNVFERRADRGKRESISCEGAANSARIAVFQVNAVSDFLGD